MTHWKKAFNPNYLGAYAFQEKEEKVVVIKSVQLEQVTDTDGGKESVLVARFEGEEKPLILNKTNCKTIEKVYKTPDIEQWPGKGLILYVTKVPAFGEISDAVRIRPAKPFICEDCKGYILNSGNVPHTEIRRRTKEKYGRCLCAACGIKAAGK